MPKRERSEPGISLHFGIAHGIFCAAALTMSIIAALAQSTIPSSEDGHFGEIADPNSWPVSAVGVVTIALFSRVHYCTGTIIAPKLILTAAHCLIDSKRIVKAGNVKFLAGLNKGVPLEHANAKRLIVAEGFSPGPPTPDDVASDWAVIVLGDALSIKPITVKSLTAEELSSASLMQIGYGRDRRYLPSIVRHCSATESADGRFLNHGCLTNAGYSGAPLIAQMGNRVLGCRH